jgi:hypothetical protein
MGMASVQSGTGEIESSGVCTTNWTSSVVDPPHAAECTKTTYALPTGTYSTCRLCILPVLPNDTPTEVVQLIYSRHIPSDFHTHTHTHTQPTD